MAILQVPGTGFAADMGLGNTTSPLVVLFERDDTIAVPLLSQLRMTGYDVRAARTPVELFGMLGKQLVALVLVDLGNATAGRREFWVALDAQRRGRSLQVMTFRFITPANALDPDFDPAARALADVEVRGVQEFQKVLDGVRQRIPLNGALPALAAPGAAYGMPSRFSQPSYSPFSQPSPLPNSQPSVPPYSSNPQVSPFAQPLSASPFAQPASSNPFSGGQPANNSPFAQPYTVNPFASGSAAPQPGGWGQAQAPASPASAASNPFGQPSQPDPMRYGQPFGGQQMPQGRQQQPAHPMGQMNQMGRDEHQIVDVWIPPEEDDQVTSVVPEATFEQIERYGQYGHMGQQGQMGQMGAALQESTQRIAAMPTAGAGYTGTPTERALSTVLVEGAMLTDQKLEALRGIQQMLTGVGMQFKLGELALLFKFLSPDQLLAALLVSRGLVSPQQISSLGRIKQELAATGKDEDLATLLLKFQVLPADQLRALQNEL
ncbi:MAG TPA: hypothetical protein VFW76_07510 [Ktedonobacterales bacterium]|nr:hypothetical protein [Ktedonobacterales bacterium]